MGIDRVPQHSPQGRAQLQLQRLEECAVIVPEIDQSKTERFLTKEQGQDNPTDFGCTPPNWFGQ